jgi:hypothetical protein
MKLTFGQKLLAVQTEVAPIIKDSDNPFYKSKYFDINKLIEMVKPVLSKHGIVVLQPLSHVVSEGKVIPTITTTLMDAESGEQITSSCPLMQGQDAQKHGASVTYFRRYALVSLLALGAEDDDANSLVKPPRGKGKAPAQQNVLDW